MDGIQNQGQNQGQGAPNPFPPQQNPSAPPAPLQNQQNFNPSPPAQVNLRTPESDMRSIGRGDAMPIPESVMAPEHTNEPVFRPETQIPGMTEIADDSAGGKKKLFIWIAISLGVVLVGGAGYFFVYPLLFPSVPDVVVDDVTPPPAPTVVLHQSLFIGSVPVTSDVILPDLFQKTIIDNFANSAKFSQPNGTVQEIIFKDASGNQVLFKSFLNAFAPALTVEMLSAWFEDDFTSFVYYDEQGAWPGFVGTLKNGVNIDAARVALSALEGADTAGFYIASPGVFDPFKDGSIGAYPMRYARATLPGASFNYGIAGSRFLVSTSYNGLKEAVELLGL